MSSLIFILIITFPLGLVLVIRKALSSIIFNVFSFLGMSIPTFWLGLVFILFFIEFGALAQFWYQNPLLQQASIWVQIWDICQHLALPLLTILVGGIAGLTRYHRFGIIKILTEDYICARARGLSERRILYKHAFKNAALPIITT